MIRNAIIRKARERNANGQDCYEAAWDDDGVPCTLRVASIGRGYTPYEVDDVVMVAIPWVNGQPDHTAGRIMALFEAAQVEPQDDADTELHAREGGNLAITGDEVHLGLDADKGVNREGDGVKIDITTDAAFIAWAAAVNAAITALNLGQTVVVPSVITSVSGETLTGSSVVKAVD